MSDASDSRPPDQGPRDPRVSGAPPGPPAGSRAGASRGGIGDPAASRPGASRPGVSRPGTSRSAASRPPDKPIEARQRVFGDYVVEAEIGRGGMGVVWLATQRSLGRRVALKVLPNFASMDASAVLRFRREAEATGRIAHPGIVPVYGVGEVDGIQYFAMEFIDGPPLGTVLEALSMRQVDHLRESWVEEAQLADRYPSLREPPATGAGNRYVRSCARLCADVANALAAAHRERVIHRDLKPNNILIHPAGRPVLVDFGLARDEQANNLTRSGEQIGTPAYMAPEQARGHRQIDGRVDVYGLGAVLYELLTMRAPFAGNTSAEITHRILTEEAVPVRKLNPNVPVDLAAIVHRCLAKAPDDRYPVVEALELDLRNFLAGKPVSASLPSAMARLQGALQRHRQSLVIASSAALVATVIAVVAGVVSDRGDVQNGRRALAEARAMLVEQRDPERARDLYERAAALTKQADEVAAQRRQDFRDAFLAFYQDKPQGPEVLRRFAAVFDDADRRSLRDVLDRLDGRGTLKFATRTLAQATRALDVRQVSEQGLQENWRPVRAGEPLPTGEYLLRATSTEGAVAVEMTTVKADGETTIAPRFLGAEELPAGFAAVVDPIDGRTIAVDTHELTRAEWRRWLQSLTDPQVAAEMVPLQWDGGEQAGDLPVRGLSFLQARAYAAANGAHLPTVREQWLAGSAGLKGLATPWGGAPDRTRLAADPYQRNEAVPVDAMPEGQSPLGVLHVLGNVAEILSAAADGRLLMGGGSFLDDPDTLRLDGKNGAVPTAPLPALDRGHAGAGMRLYRFVSPVDDPKADAASKQRREELRGGETNGVQLSCVFHDWTLRRDGALDVELELDGVYDPARHIHLRHFDTPGFLQVPGTVRSLDGHRQDLGAEAVIKVGGEGSVLPIDPPASLRPGQGYRYFMTARLQPVDGLLPQRDGYVLRLPIKRGYSVAQVYTLTLPPDCAIEEVSPPATQWTVGGETRLAWEQTAGEQIETAIVRFRADGALGKVLASRTAAAERCRLFLRVLNERSSQLGPLLDRDFELQPGSLDRAAVMAQRTNDRLNFVELVDSVRIGDIETSEVTVDWEMRDRDGRRFVLSGWPFLLQWRHEGNTARAVRLQPFTQADQGRYEDGGGYAQGRRMRVRIDPVPGTALVRTQDELCELQVKLTHEGLQAQVLGCFADANDTVDAIRFRLTGGASMLRPGRLLGETRGDDGTTQEWSFIGGEDSSRERWSFVQRGSRHLLLRFAAADRDAAQATAAFDSPAAQAWFAAVRAAVHVD